MAGPTRRTFLKGAAAAATVTVIPTAAFAQSVRQSDAGNTLFKAVGKHLYGSETAKDLQDKVKIDVEKRTIEGLATADQVEAAFTKAWNEVSDSPFAKELVQEARDGNKDKLRYLTTDEGGGDYSVTSYMKTVFDDYAVTASNQAAKGQIGSSDFNAIRDRGLQAFMHNVADQVKSSGYDKLDDSKKLAPYLPVVTDMVQADWAKGFEQFVENTLIPSIEAAPEAPKASATPKPVLTLERK